jgi:5-methylcytosine-specific restriction endonuclease McrA
MATPKSEKRKAYEREYGKMYRANNKEKIRAYTKEWNKNNRDYKRQQVAAWYQKNRTRIRRKWRQDYYPKNRDWIIQRALEYAKKYPETYNTRNAQRRARKRNAAPPKTIYSSYERLFIRDLYSKAKALEEETGVKWEVDHIVPLCAGGKHEYNNLQVIPKTINVMKGGRVLKNPVWGTEGFWESLEEAMI